MKGSRMSFLSFSGSSDDLIGVLYNPTSDVGTLTVVDRNGGRRKVTGDRPDEEFNVRDGYTEFLVNIDGVDAFVVFARYGKGGCWGFGVSQVDEDTFMHANISVVQSEISSYSVELTAELFKSENVIVYELQD